MCKENCIFCLKNSASNTEEVILKKIERENTMLTSTAIIIKFRTKISCILYYEARKLANYIKDFKPVDSGLE